MTLTFDDALHCAKTIQNYFNNYDRIDQYMRDQKLDSLIGYSSGGVLGSIEDNLFSDFDMHPNDMDFDVFEMKSDNWEAMLNVTSSHINISPVGRQIRLGVQEKKTGKYVGFLRLGSPVINMKPRNEMLGQVFTKEKNWSERFNHSAMMGFVIVPAQPFGYNYLGGKLLAAICVSHEIRQIVNAKYGMNLCLFETTSLYGNTKSVSQYDGMKPFIRYKGLTDSDFIPMIHGKTYDDLRVFVENRIGNIVKKEASSKKLKTTMKIIDLVKSSLKDTPEGNTFIETIRNAKGLTEQKRYYVSDYGLKNMVDYVNCKTDTLVPGENYDKHNLSNVISWWKNKASNRYENLKTENKLRNELEVWTSGKSIDIIR
jgi:hypothetical protein